MNSNVLFLLWADSLWVSDGEWLVQQALNSSERQGKVKGHACTITDQNHLLSFVVKWCSIIV